jgi:hypothetical protein
MGTDLGLTVPGLDRLARTPHRPDGLNVTHGQPLRSANDHGVVNRLNIQDVARLAVGSRNSQSQTTPLTDSEMVISIVATDESTGLVTDLTVCRADFL